MTITGRVFTSLDHVAEWIGKKAEKLDLRGANVCAGQLRGIRDTLSRSTLSIDHSTIGLEKKGSYNQGRMDEKRDTFDHVMNSVFAGSLTTAKDLLDELRSGQHVTTREDNTEDTSVVIGSEDYDSPSVQYTVHAPRGCWFADEDGVGVEVEDRLRSVLEILRKPAFDLSDEEWSMLHMKLQQLAKGLDV